ncbi:MAG: hypothetical protein FWE66_00280, partial [Oscillospiraceae bacterium]|nr:hypothetical protein [Oscillospiraceae bacterium]
MKRFIALVLALAMLVPFALAGCSKSDGGSGSSSSGGASSGGSSSSGSSSSGSGGAAAPQETIKFGGVWGITGSTKATGDYCREATALAIEAINEA